MNVWGTFTKMVKHFGTHELLLQTHLVDLVWRREFYVRAVIIALLVITNRRIKPSRKLKSELGQTVCYSLFFIFIYFFDKYYKLGIVDIILIMVPHACIIGIITKLTIMAYSKSACPKTPGNWFSESVDRKSAKNLLVVQTGIVPHIWIIN